MYLITGANGFIGSVLVGYLNSLGIKDLILVDDFVHYPDKTPNLQDKDYLVCVERDTLFSVWDQEQWPLQGVFHLGARTDTTEVDVELFDRLNREYSRGVWQRCSRYALPLVYASSAATYGLGEAGFRDDLPPRQLLPLNEYGRSKNDFDAWALEQGERPPHWYGLKFFNVYGPNEYHKGRMASVVWHTFRQVRATGGMKLFRSHRDGIADGQQKRDFIYVLDLCRVCHWLMVNLPDPSGLYNLGTGTARSFLDLATATFQAMEREPSIAFVDTPADLRENYQYFTEADLTRLRELGYPHPFTSLEEGVGEYVRNYLIEGQYY